VHASAAEEGREGLSRAGRAPYWCWARSPLGGIEPYRPQLTALIKNAPDVRTPWGYCLQSLTDGAAV